MSGVNTRNKLTAATATARRDGRTLAAAATSCRGTVSTQQRTPNRSAKAMAEPWPRSLLRRKTLSSSDW